MPSELRGFLDALEIWALGNEKDAKHDTVKFWAFKVPAILGSASSGLFAALQWPPWVPAVVGFVAGACVALDGIVHPGTLRAVHVRAFHDIRNLENAVYNEWQIAALEGRNTDELAAGIYQRAEKRRVVIADYLAAAEGTATAAEGTKPPGSG